MKWKGIVCLVMDLRLFERKTVRNVRLFEIDVCDYCHQISTPKQCVFCGGDQISKVQFPYACKLLFHELQAMSLKIELLTN